MDRKWLTITITTIIFLLLGSNLGGIRTDNGTEKKNIEILNSSLQISNAFSEGQDKSDQMYRDAPGDNYGGEWFQTDEADFDSGIFNGISFNDSKGNSRLELEQNSSKWKNMNPANRPGARQGTSMVYDPINDRVVLFGGFNGNYLDDTWEYDLVNNTWININPNPAPTPRRQHSMVYDSVNRKIVLFGGWRYPDNKYDTWVYDVGTKIWTPKNPDPHPEGRRSFSMAFDDTSGKTVLYGGEKGGTRTGNKLNDTWTYDLTTNTWLEKHPGNPPEGRGGAIAAFDPNNSKTTIFSGTVGYDAQVGDLVDELWTYDLNQNQWAEKILSSGPIGMHSPRMIYDEWNDGILLFGGYNGTFFDDTWIYNCSSEEWLRVFTDNAPSARNSFGFTYNNNANLGILFGGNNNNYLRDTWVFRSAQYETNGNYTSEIIDISSHYKWSKFSIQKKEYDNNRINVSIYDADTGMAFEGLDDITDDEADLTLLNEMDVSSIYLKAFFKGDGKNSPLLESWGVDWSIKEGWWDGFIGDSKIDSINSSLPKKFVADQDTFGLWHFNEVDGDNAFDSSNNGNTISLQNTDDDIWQYGRFSNGIWTDGVNDYGKLSSNNFKVQPFSIGVWIKTFGKDQQLVSYANANSYYGWRVRLTSDGKISFHLANSVGTAIAYVESLSQVNDGEWHQLFCVDDGNDLKIYIDGKIEGTSSSTNAAWGSNMRLYLGASRPESPLANKWWKGAIDELWLISRALTYNDIVGHYYPGLTNYDYKIIMLRKDFGPMMDCSCYWGFDEGVGDTLTDSTPDQINGSCINMDQNNWVQSIQDTGLSFDGTEEYVDLPEGDNIFNIQRDFTINTIIKPNRLNHPTTQEIIDINYWNSDAHIGNGISIQIGGNQNQLTANLFLQDDGDGERYGLTSNLALQVGEIYFVTLKRDNDILSFYFNGILDNSVMISSNDVMFTVNRADITGDYNTIGMFHRQDGNIYWHFQGMLDEMSIYNRPLSNQEIIRESRLYRLTSQVRSETITLPENSTWNSFYCNRDIPQDSFLNISVLNASNDEVIYVNEQSSGEFIWDMTTLPSPGPKEIYLIADLRSTLWDTPILHSWGVNWTVEEVNNTPDKPVLLLNIPNILVDEDSHDQNLMDLSLFYNDSYAGIQPSAYDISNVSDNDHIRLLVNGSYLHLLWLADNWTGNVSVIVNCTNYFNISTPSNTFIIQITNVNDPPTWLSQPQRIEVDEDNSTSTIYSLDEYALDVDSSTLSFSIESFDENISATLTNDNRVEITSMNNFTGNTSITAGVRDNEYNKTILVEIPVVVNPVNDKPICTLNYPVDGAIINGPLITLTWNTEDVDDPLEDILYDLYLGVDPNPPLYQSSITKTNFTFTELKSNTTYYWKVIPFDSESVGICRNGTNSFRISMEDNIPYTELIYPENNTNLQTNYVTLRWEKLDWDLNIYYNIYLGNSKEELFEIITIKENHFNLSGIEENKIYYWQVIPEIRFNQTNVLEGICQSGVWQFSTIRESEVTYSLTLARNEIQIAPGGITTINITLTNTCPIDLLINISVSGELSDSFNFPKNIPLDEDAVKIVTITVNISSSALEKEYPHIIMTESRNVKHSELFTLTVKQENQDIDEENKKSDDQGFKVWIIILIICILLLIIAGIVIFLLLRNKKQKEVETPDHAENYDNIDPIDHGTNEGHMPGNDGGVFNHPIDHEVHSEEPGSNQKQVLPLPPPPAGPNNSNINKSAGSETAPTELNLQCHGCGSDYSTLTTEFPVIVTCPHCGVKGEIDSY